MFFGVRAHKLHLTYSPRDNPYEGQYTEAPPKRGTFFRLQVYERVGNSDFLVGKKAL